MKVVSNTSPLIFLAKLDAFGLLACFTAISIPTAVLKECEGLELPKSINVVDLGAKAQAAAHANLGRLHRGELEAIVLAAQIKADYVLMDDAKARSFAKTKGVKPMGTIGVLLLANKQGLLSDERGKRYLDALKDEHGLYISESLFETVKQSFR